MEKIVPLSVNGVPECSSSVIIKLNTEDNYEGTFPSEKIVHWILNIEIKCRKFRKNNLKHFSRLKDSIVVTKRRQFVETV